MNWKEFILYDANIGEPTKRNSTKLIKPTGEIKYRKCEIADENIYSFISCNTNK